MRLMLFMLFLLEGVTQVPPSDALLAKHARNFLEMPENQAGYEADKKCEPTNKKSKKPKLECRVVTISLDVSLAVKKEGDRGFTLIKVEGSGPKLCTSKTPGFQVFCYVQADGTTNGVGTEYGVIFPSGYKVYALRRVVSSTTGLKEVVYSPYSSELNTQAVRSAGEKYLNWVIWQAFTQLHNEGVRSRSDPSELVVNRVPRDLLRKLAIIEHIDEGRLVKDGFENLMHKVYVTFGLNQELAYRYSVSSSGARGVIQIIRNTYDGVIGIFPTAKIKKEFFEGTVDHVNAMKVAILLIDHNVELLPPELRAVLFASPVLYEQYAASAYNGGPTCPRSEKRKGLCAKELLVQFGEFVKNNPNEHNRLYVAKLLELQRIPSKSQMLVSN